VAVPAGESVAANDRKFWAASERLAGASGENRENFLQYPLKCGEELKPRIPAASAEEKAAKKPKSGGSLRRLKQ